MKRGNMSYEFLMVLVFFSMFAWVASAAPNCTVISVTPSDLQPNSTGTFEAIINCTDPGGLNISSFVITRTMEGSQHAGIPNLWSIRPPENNASQNHTCVPHNIPQILRADGRADGKWYDSIFSDNFTYAANDNSSMRVTIINGTTWATLNFTYKVETTVFRSAVYLSRGMMEKAQKYNYSIYKNNNLLVKVWDLEHMRGAENYTLCGFANLHDDGSVKDLKVYYCNSSYDPTGSTKPEDSPYCTYQGGLDENYILPANEYYTSRNSTYSRIACMNITNSTFAGIKITDTGYIDFETTEASSAKAYKFSYANSSSGTNVSFKDSNTAWTTTDGGETWIQADFTPDIWRSTVVASDQFQMGVFIKDLAGNNFTNFSLYTDDLGDVNYSISKPNIENYYSISGGMDEDRNGTHRGTMTIRVNIAIDPDEVGSVNHSLYLRNTDGSANYTINNSFYSADDSDINVTFDTTLVPDGLYRMNVTAVADDDPADIQSYLTVENFTINNSIADAVPPNITFISQVPADVSSFNALQTPINITYNINDSFGVNTSTVKIYYKTNSSLSDCWIAVNGTDAFCGYGNMSYKQKTADTYRFWLFDNDIYPATYNFDENIMENTSHSIYTLSQPNYVIKTSLFNVSNSKEYGFLEVMVNTSDTRELEFYYCNSSYAGGVIFSNPYCTEFYTLLDNATYNHTHPPYSYHHVIPFSVNLTTGKLGDVYVTPFSYFVLKPTLIGSGSWNAYYISNVSRSDAVQVSTNVGNSWSDLSGTLDLHLHQYDGDESLCYYVCANDTSGNGNCSIERCDTLDLGDLPPTSPFVYNPTNATYAGNFSINYTAALPPKGCDCNISFYNITLLNPDGSLNKIIQSNNSVNLSYQWDSTTTADGVYFIKVEACDILGQCSFGLSQNFTIDNTEPSIALNQPAPGDITNSSTVNFNWTAYDNLDTVLMCNLTLDGTVNVSDVSSPNGTATVQPVPGVTDGIHYWNVTCWDNANNTNISETRNFTVDASPPLLAIQSPTNTTYNVSTVDLNFSVSDTNPVSCWYYLNGAGPTALPGCANTTLAPGDGSYNLTVFANDSAGNTNSSTVYFTIDASPPLLAIQSPTNTSYNISWIGLTYIVSDPNIDSCWQVIDNLAPAPLAGCNNVSLGAVALGDGPHNVTVYVNDTAGNVNSSTVYFSIDLTPPSLTVQSPTNTTYATSSVALDYTVSDNIAVGYCWYYHDGSGPDDLAGCANTTLSSLLNGPHNVTVVVNDTTGNTNSTTVFFTVDVPPPPPSDGGDGGKDKKSLNVEWQQRCPENEIGITVSYGNEPVENIDVLLMLYDPPGGSLGTKDTDDDGQAFFSITAEGTYRVYFSSDNYEYPDEPLVIQYSFCEEEPECASDSDCPAAQYCDDGECRDVECECGYVENHECISYECCSDGECAEGYVCEDNACVLPAECESDSDCAEDEYCSDGSCAHVTEGECGYVENHAWYDYECCADEDCDGYPYEICSENVCEPREYDLQLVNKTPVVAGRDVVIVLYQDGVVMPGVWVVVESPSGRTFEGYTDEKGLFTFVPDIEGIYRINAYGAGDMPLASVSFEAGTAGVCCIWFLCGIFGFVEFLGICWYWWVLLILLIVTAALLYYYYGKFQKKEKKYMPRGKR